MGGEGKGHFADLALQGLHIVLFAGGNADDTDPVQLDLVALAFNHHNTLAQAVSCSRGDLLGCLNWFLSNHKWFFLSDHRGSNDTSSDFRFYGCLHCHSASCHIITLADSLNHTIIPIAGNTPKVLPPNHTEHTIGCKAGAGLANMIVIGHIATRTLLTLLGRYADLAMLQHIVAEITDHLVARWGEVHLVVATRAPLA